MSKLIKQIPGKRSLTSAPSASLPPLFQVWSAAGSCIMLSTLCCSPSFADAISPSISDSGKVYSTEEPDSGYFGTGPVGKLSEASHLRFRGEQLMSDGKIDDALKVLSKAVQFDPADPTGHLMLARAMTTKLRSNRNEIDWQLYGQCLDEWRLIARHDADHLEQLEARNTMSALKRMAKDYIAGKMGKPKKRSLMASINPLKMLK